MTRGRGISWEVRTLGDSFETTPMLHANNFERTLLEKSTLVSDPQITKASLSARRATCRKRVMILTALGGVTLAFFALVAVYGYNIVWRFKLRNFPGPKPSWMLGKVVEGSENTEYDYLCFRLVPYLHINLPDNVNYRLQVAFRNF